MFETLFLLAARCAKSIGVHQWHNLRGQVSDEEIEEMRNVSYCLYTLDKVVCWTAGSSPTISSSEVYIDSSLSSPDDPTMCHLMSKVKLCLIEETIYLEAYASQARWKSKPKVLQLCSEIHHRLQGWLTDAGIDLHQAEHSLEYPAPKTELAVDFLCTQMLLIWPFQGQPDAEFAHGQNIARRWMELTLRLWTSPPDQTHQMPPPL